MHARLIQALCALSSMSMLMGTAKCQAATTVSVQVDNCSGERRTVEAEDHVLIECTGNLAMSHGSITSDVKLIISGRSTLNLANLMIAAPALELRSNNSIAVGDGTLFDMGISSLSIAGSDGQSLPTAYFSGPVRFVDDAASPWSTQAPTSVSLASAGTVPILSAVTIQTGPATTESGDNTGGGAPNLVFGLLLAGAILALRCADRSRIC